MLTRRRKSLLYLQKLFWKYLYFKIKFAKMLRLPQYSEM